MGAKRRHNVEFCCCAIPLVNFGAYAILLEHSLIALCVIVLALAPPSIVAATGSLPASWPKIVVALLGVLVLLLQPLGVIGVARQKPTLYRVYLRLTTVAVLVTLGVCAAFFAVAAARHAAALQSCIATYANTPQGDGSGVSFSQTSSALDSLGDTICNIWLWVQVGTMGLVLLLVGMTQLYMLFLQRAYGAQQRAAYTAHKSLHAGGVDIPLSARLDDERGGVDGDNHAWSAAPAQRLSDEYAYPAAAPYGAAARGGGAHADKAYNPTGATYADEEPYQPYPQPQYAHAAYDSYGGAGHHAAAPGAAGYESYGAQDAYRR